MSSILIRNAIICTMNNKLLQGDIFVEDDKITEIARSIDRKADKTFDATGKVVMPGFVNAHSETGSTLFRSYLDDYSEEDDDRKSLKALEEKMKPEDVYTASMLAFVEMIKSGTTTFNDSYFYAEETAKAAEEIGIRGIVSQKISGDGDEAKLKLQETEEFYSSLNNKADGRINVIVSLDSPSNCSPDTIKKTSVLAQKLNVPINIEFLENKNESEIIKDKYNLKVIDYLKQNDLFKCKTILSHAVWADEYDLAEMQFHDVSVVANPVSNCKLGNGVPDIKFLVEGGINCALGTDGASSSSTLDMFEEIKACAYTQKLLYKRASAITAKKVLEMATIKGAKALGLQKDVGAIEVGKKADIIIIDLDKPHFNPVHNLYSALAYSANGADVETVIINGKVIMEDRKILTVNEAEITQKARELAKNLIA